VEKRNVLYDRAHADDDHARLPALAAELVARIPDLIYAPPQNAAIVAKRATSTIPIVFGTATDPVGFGLVESLARPGGNVTGIATLAVTLLPKALEILREILPHAKRLALLGDPADPRAIADHDALHALAPRFGLTILSADVAAEGALDGAVAQLVAKHAHAILTNSSITFNLRHRLLALTSKARIPVVGQRAELADAGALFSYNAPLSVQLRRSAHLVDKVLKGASPASLPIEQATQFELVFNLRTAEELGLRVPASILARADRVIA
jgi:putative tryptophan/tyrosine transport system substrate-binding protein